MFGHCNMNIKMVPIDSAGTVTAVYLSSQNAEHDKIDFEFLGNRTGQRYFLQTNVFTCGQGNKDQFKQIINNLSMLQRKKVYEMGTNKKSNSLHKGENIPVLARWSMLGNANPFF